ncbi:MAG: hypothetical protein L6V90_10035 [Treponema succinifaciens]|nr:MAG: hypothetical protein L6V90_10035 [Treponema succinifaciens]
MDDIPEQADKAESVIKQGSFTLPEIIAEVVYVLTKLYKVPRNEIKSIVVPVFLMKLKFRIRKLLLMRFLFFSETSFDFC